MITVIPWNGWELISVAGTGHRRQVTRLHLKIYPIIVVLISGNDIVLSILIDTCPYGHGIWLDEGEIDKIQIYSEKWAAQADDIPQAYATALKKVKADVDQRYEKMREETRVSRFGPVNRLIRKIVY